VINPSAYIPEEEPMSFFQRLTSAYFEPSKAFADVNRRPSWLALFIVLALLTMATAFVVAMRVDQEALIRKSIESLGIQMSEEQMNQALASQRTPLARYQSMISAPVYIIVSNLVIAAIFMVLFMLAGTSLNYRKSLAVTFWGLGPPGAIESILYILILFMDSKAHPIMASLAGSIDVFSFWKMALLAIGFAAISDRKLTAKKAGIGVIVLWVVYVIGKALIVGGFRSLVSR
jgi:hypothetical protein